MTFEDANPRKPIVCFGSFQDYLGKNTSTGGIKTKNEWVHATNWDCVIFDGYHYGAWRENAKELFEAEGKKELEFGEGEGIDYFDEEEMPITANHYLYLSGTPFRAIASGEFIEEQIFNWTYSDEQSAKQNWDDSKGSNPYAALPRMVIMTYQLPDSIRQIAMQGEFDGFDLNIFFSAGGDGANARFKYEDEVQKWLDLIRGSFSETTVDNLKMGAKKPPLPFSHAPLLNVLNHTFWFLPTVTACNAMANLLRQRQNKFYHDYTAVVAAGTQAGIGVHALPPVQIAMTDNPLESKTITLSCGKLTTGVSVKPWTGIFMLRNSSSPETYFQAAFRVQTPWVIKNPDSKSPNKEDILKEECYVFDFAPDRALRQIADYNCRLNVNESNPEAVKKARKEANDKELSSDKKKELSKEEKEYRNLRKQIQEKLIKFAIRVPVFMYLTDYREHSLKDVITQLEPGLFKKVTGLSVKDFELLVSLGVFNSALMNDAVYKFKRYEDASLEYIGVNKHEGQKVGLYDTVLSRKDYEESLAERIMRRVL